MKIGIVSFSPKGKPIKPEEKLLRKIGQSRGHTMHIIRADRCNMIFKSTGQLGMKYGSSPLPKCDVFIPRASVLTNVHIRAAIIEQLQLMNFPVINGFQSILRAKSKLQTLQTLSYYGIPVVKTAVIQSKSYLDEASRFISSTPLIMKTSYSSYGNGVALVESKRALKSTYGMLADTLTGNNSILIQQYIQESAGKDLRLFVVGNEVIASMERIAQDGDFRSNVGQGGTGRAYTPSEKETHLAIKASKAIGLDIAGVDIIKTKRGPAIMEVNANPGFVELEKCTGISVAEKIIHFAEKFVQEYVPAKDIV